MRRGLRTVALLLVGAWAFGCDAPSRETYQVRGVVRAVDREHAQAKIAHEEIPGFMPAMTMNFDVAPPEILDGVEPGARVRFVLERNATVLRITRLEKTGIDPEAPTDGELGGLQEREQAPSFSLTDQEGRPVSLEDLRGKAILLDFVFTTCTGPCPILTSLHVALQRRLPPEVADRTYFLSVSVDPETDTPAALRRYATERGADLDSWSFLTGPPDRVADVLDRYRVGRMREPDGTLNHLVLTFLIDPGGWIARRYIGLDHPPEKVLRDLEEVLS